MRRWLRSAKSVFSEQFPFTCLIFLLHQKHPTVCFWIPGERIVERAVRILEDKLDAVTGAYAITQCFGESTAEDINPVPDISFAGVVIADVNHGLIIRWA